MRTGRQSELQQHLDLYPRAALLGQLCWRGVRAREQSLGVKGKVSPS